MQLVIAQHIADTPAHHGLYALMVLACLLHHSLESSIAASAKE